MPGQLGPIRRVLLRDSFDFIIIMSRTGIPSVMQTTRSMLASIDSRMESLPNWGGTTISEVLAPSLQNA